MKRSSLILTAAMCISAVVIQAQDFAPLLQSGKLIGGSGDDFTKRILKTTDGNYVLFGESVSNNRDKNCAIGMKDFWLVKVSDTGRIIWSKCYGGTKDEAALGICNTSDGGFIMTGGTNSGASPIGFQKGWVVKLNSNGAIVWQHVYGGNAWDYFYKLLLTDNAIYIAGYTSSTDLPGANVFGNSGIRDGYLVKLDGAGNLIWQQCYGYRGAKYLWIFYRAREKN